MESRLSEIQLQQISEAVKEGSTSGEILSDNGKKGRWDMFYMVEEDK